MTAMCVVEHLVDHAAHEPIAGRVVWHTLESDCAAQVSVLGEPDFGLAEGAVHQARMVISCGRVNVCLENLPK